MCEGPNKRNWIFILCVECWNKQQDGCPCLCNESSGSLFSWERWILHSYIVHRKSKSSPLDKICSFFFFSCEKKCVCTKCHNNGLLGKLIKALCLSIKESFCRINPHATGGFSSVEKIQENIVMLFISKYPFLNFLTFFSQYSLMERISIIQWKDRNAGVFSLGESEIRENRIPLCAQAYTKVLRNYRDLHQPKKNLKTTVNKSRTRGNHSTIRKKKPTISLVVTYDQLKFLPLLMSNVLLLDLHRPTFLWVSICNYPYIWRDTIQRNDVKSCWHWKSMWMVRPNLL